MTYWFSICKSTFKYTLFSFLTLFVLCSSGECSSKYGGTLVRATTSDPKSFNAILAKETSTTLVTSHIFDALTTTNPFTLKVEPHIAKSWSISEDGLVWTFNLRDDVYFNDGKKLTAFDVEFTFNELIFNPDIPSSARDIFTIDGKPFVVKAIKKYLVEFALPVKFAPFLRGLSGQEILPKHILADVVANGKFNQHWGIDTPAKNIVGSGPFMLQKYEPGSRIVFKRNPYYWKKSSLNESLPYMDRIIFLILQNQDILMLKFLEGSIDSYGLRGLDYPLLKPIEAKSDFTIHELGPDSGSQFIFFNQNPGINPNTNEPYVKPYKLKWFTNVEFRRAVAHAIDKEKIIEIVSNRLGYPQDSPVGPAAGFFHNPNVAKYPYDLDKARQILEKQGFKDRDNDGVLEDREGNRVEFTLSTNAGSTDRVDIAGIVRQDLERLGMKVNYQGREFNMLVRKLSSTYDWEAIILGLTGGVEPHFGKNVWTSSGQLHMWYPKQESPATDWERRIDELFSLGVQELDEDKRKEYYDEFQVIVSENVPLIYTVLGANIVAVRDKFENLKPTNLSGIFHNIEEIYIKDEYK